MRRCDERGEREDTARTNRVRRRRDRPDHARAHRGVESPHAAVVETMDRLASAMVATARRVVVSVDTIQLRRDLGLTSGQFARLVGASHSTVSRWEHGHAEPDGALASICASIRAAVDGPRGEAVRRLVREHFTLPSLLDALFNAYRPPP